MWLISQRWENLLFAHWAVEPGAVRRHLPPGVEPDTRDGAAWAAIVAFVMTGTRLCAGPRRPELAPIPELNVRTYVHVDGVPGVWFLSLDANSPLFVTIGRAWYGLGYRLTPMTVVRDSSCIHYLSASGFSATYEPAARAAPAASGSLEHFLIERYRLFALRRGRLVTAEVAHEPWELAPATARIELNRLAPPGVGLSGPPLLHFSRGVDALVAAPSIARRGAPVGVRDRRAVVVA